VTQNPGAAEVLAALAGEVRDLAGKVADLPDDLPRDIAWQVAALAKKWEDLPDDIGQVPEHVVALAKEVERLGAAVSDLQGVDRIAPADWLSLSVEEADQRWGELADWISDVLVDGYRVTRAQLPDCWARHRPAVIHLCWMQASYEAAYRPGATPTLAAEWSTSWLDKGLAKLRVIAPPVTCRPRPGAVGVHNMTTSQEEKAVAAALAKLSPEERHLRELAERRAASTTPVRRAPASSSDNPEDMVARLPGAGDLAVRRYWEGHLAEAVPADADWRKARTRPVAENTRRTL
jgi:hypothetical protein